MTDESELIDGVLSGDEDAFRRIYRSQTPRLYRLALGLVGGRDADAQDLVQEAWLRAVRGLEGFERRSSLRSWLSAIVARCAAERHRRSRRRPGDQSAGTGAVDHLDGRSAPDGMVGVDGALRTARRLDLERAFERLPFGFRAVLILHDVEGFRHREIGDLLGISDGTSKSQLSRARRRMRDLLGEDYADQ